MKPRFHNLSAFQNTNAALEVRDMIPSSLGYSFLFPVNDKSKEVPVC